MELRELASKLRVLGLEDAVTAARAEGTVEGFVSLVRGRPGARGHVPAQAAYAADLLGLPAHLGFVLSELCREAEAGERAWPDSDELASIPFHDVCYGLLLPLEGLAQPRARRLFGMSGPGRLDSQGRLALL